MPIEEITPWKKITINGRWLEKEREVREGVVNAFQQLLLDEPAWKADIEGLHLQSLNHNEAEGLEQPFTEEKNSFCSDGNEWR